MENYYDEILEEIRSLMTQGKNEEAFARVNQELSMPYIPPDVEPELKKYRRELNYRLSEKEGTHEESTDVLLERLHGKPEEQLGAAASLSSRNLRDLVPEINAWLGKDPQPEAAALIVEAIAEQEIGDEFVWNRDGVEYTFWGDSVTPVARSSGFQKANQYLYDWFGNDNPDLYEMAKTLLIHEVYLFLPLSYGEQEAQDLAYEMAENVCQLMGNEEALQEIRKRLGMNSTADQGKVS